jgi:chromosome segregation ATPase
MVEQLTPVAASKTLKDLGTQITQWENRLEIVKGEIENSRRTKDALQSEIEKKRSDFEIYINGRDAEVKKMRADLLAEREQLVKDKNEFQAILLAHRNDKNVIEEQKRQLELEKSKHAGTIQNVQEFVTAVRRAVGLLNI